MVLAVDFVRRNFEDTLLGALDLNRFNRFINGVQTPVIPRCTTAAQRAIRTRSARTGRSPSGRPAAARSTTACSSNSTSASRTATCSARSYAFTDRDGINGIGNPIPNLDNYFESYGPTGARHLLESVGARRFAGERADRRHLGDVEPIPVMPTIASVDLDGDGITTTPIPGLEFNCFNRGCDKDDLAQAVAQFNAQYAGQRDARGQAIPSLALPADYEFGDTFSSQDVRRHQDLQLPRARQARGLLRGLQRLQRREPRWLQLQSQ